MKCKKRPEDFPDTIPFNNDFQTTTLQHARLQFCKKNYISKYFIFTKNNRKFRFERLLDRNKNKFDLSI